MRKATGVRAVVRSGDRVEALRLDIGEEVRARHFLDAFSVAGVLRRAMITEGWVRTELDPTKPCLKFGNEPSNVEAAAAARA